MHWDHLFLAICTNCQRFETDGMFVHTVSQRRTQSLDQEEHFRQLYISVGQYGVSNCCTLFRELAWFSVGTWASTAPKSLSHRVTDHTNMQVFPLLCSARVSNA